MHYHLEIMKLHNNFIFLYHINQYFKVLNGKESNNSLINKMVLQKMNMLNNNFLLDFIRKLPNDEQNVMS